MTLRHVAQTLCSARRANPIVLAAGVMGFTALAAPVVSAAVIRATLVLKEGDMPAYATGSIDGLSDPFTLGSGEPVILATLEDGNHILWVDGVIVWAARFERSVWLGGSGNQHGATADGAFVYTPSEWLAASRTYWTGLKKVDTPQGGYPCPESPPHGHEEEAKTVHRRVQG